MYQKIRKINVLIDNNNSNNNNNNDNIIEGDKDNNNVSNSNCGYNRNNDNYNNLNNNNIFGLTKSMKKLMLRWLSTEALDGQTEDCEVEVPLN